MTSHRSASDARLAPASRRLGAAARAGWLALGLVIAPAVSALAQQAPATAPPPPKPVVARPTSQAPAPPYVAPPPPAGRRAAAAPTTVTRVATPAPALRAPAPVGLPADSVRRKPAAAALAVSAPPANVVAQCKDGTFIVAPGSASDCASRRGLQVTMTQRAAPPAPVSRVTGAAASRAAPAPPATPPPAGATMRCRDGTYLGGTPTASACDAHAGLAMTMPVRGTPPPPAAVTSAPRPAPKGGVSVPAAATTTTPAATRPAPAKPAQARPAPAKPATPPGNP